MTLWTPSGVYGLLLLAGMPKNRCTEFVAIAECESSLHDDAVSPTGAIGLWQVEPTTAAAVGFTAAEMYNPQTNALAAVRISGGGSNCAAWDTCYANIGFTGRYSFLNWPEKGSCAENRLGGVSAGVGTHNTGGAAPPPFPGVSGTIATAVSVMQTLTHAGLPGSGRLVGTRAAAARRIYVG